MIDISNIDYSTLDRPEVLDAIFHPRPDISLGTDNDSREIFVPVEDGTSVGSKFHLSETTSPNILYFHGNGEIVSDFDDLGAIFNKFELNFLPVDYRGYGRSGGTPTVTGMMRDCHYIFDFVRNWLNDNSYTGPLLVMGRSLGSACALELACNYKDFIQGLIIESGFANASHLLELLGIDTRTLGFREEIGFRNVDKISVFDKPCLVIHAELDHIIPFSDGKKLYEACPSEKKEFLNIPEANHNDIFFRDLEGYMHAVKRLADRTKQE